MLRFIVAGILILTLNINAQSKYADSLETEMIRFPQDSSRINRYVDLLENLLREKNYERGLKLAQEVEKRFNWIEDKKLYKIYNLQGFFNERLGNLEKAYQFYRIVYSLALTKGDLKGQSDFYQNMARIYLDNSVYDKCIESLSEAEKLEGKINNYKRKLNVYSTTAKAYEGKKDYLKALEYEKKILVLAEANENKSVNAAILNRVGYYYLLAGDLKNAEVYILRAIETAKQSDNLRILGFSHIYYGDYFFKINNYTEALKNYRIGEKYSTFNKLTSAGAELQNKIGHTLFLLGKTTEAKIILKKSFQLSDKMKYYVQLITSCNIMAKIDSVNGDFKSALLMRNKVMEIRNILNDADKGRELGRIQANSDLEKAERESLIEQDKRNEEYSRKMANQKLMIYSAIFIIPLLIFAIYWLHRSRKQKNKLNEILAQKVNERTRELLLAKEKAEASENLKSIFLSHMSHEIRTPLNAVMNLSGVLKEEYRNLSNDEIFDIIKGIDRSGYRIIRTIEMILNYSEMTGGSYQPIFKIVSIETICYKILSELKQLVADNNLEIDFSKGKGDFPFYGDEYSIHAVITNIIENAAIYTMEGNINLSLYEEDNKYIFACKDTGIGISDEYLKQLFLPFSQEEIGYTRRYEGLGLGLALSKLYCDLNRLDISCESKKWEGSTFTIIFPKNI